MNDFEGKNALITGASSGVAATVVGTADASGDDPITICKIFKSRFNW